MTLEQRGHYPEQTIRVVPFPADLASLFAEPEGLIEGSWPPTQITYLGAYLQRLDCRSIVIEHHYIDRDYIHDHALLYSRSLRAFPNYCYRLHYFREAIDEARWEGLLVGANSGSVAMSESTLQSSYLGFTVVRPLPGSPIGRTVLPTLGETTPTGLRRSFPTVRDYRLHLAGLSLTVRGLAFQQQDQGVSACATAALWSALHRTAPLEHLPIPTPAEITEAASRYLLVEGRALPSEGLTIQQICEATRASGLSPLVVRSTGLDHDRAQLAAYIGSGFPVILALRPMQGSDGHAICALGMKLGPAPPKTNPNLHYADGAGALVSVYAHDDRLGPYASVKLFSHTTQEGIRTGVSIEWPGTGALADLSILQAMIVPVPAKLRLTAARMRELGHVVAEILGRAFHATIGDVTLSCRYALGVDYQRNAFAFGLSDDGIRALTGKLVLSRYVGILEIGSAAGPLADILVDTTETRANPAVLACVRRAKTTPDQEAVLGKFSGYLAAGLIS